MMPTTYAKWICEICMRFGNNLSKMWSFADFKRTKIGYLHPFTEKTLQWRAERFDGDRAPE